MFTTIGNYPDITLIITPYPTTPGSSSVRNASRMSVPAHIPRTVISNSTSYLVTSLQRKYQGIADLLNMKSMKHDLGDCLTSTLLMMLFPGSGNNESFGVGRHVIMI